MYMRKIFKDDGTIYYYKKKKRIACYVDKIMHYCNDCIIQITCIADKRLPKLIIKGYCNIKRRKAKEPEFNLEPIQPCGSCTHCGTSPQCPGCDSTFYNFKPKEITMHTITEIKCMDKDTSKTCLGDMLQGTKFVCSADEDAVYIRTNECENEQVKGVRITDGLMATFAREEKYQIIAEFNVTYKTRL